MGKQNKGLKMKLVSDPRERFYHYAPAYPEKDTIQKQIDVKVMEAIDREYTDSSIKDPQYLILNPCDFKKLFRFREQGEKYFYYHPCCALQVIEAPSQAGIFIGY